MRVASKREEKGTEKRKDAALHRVINSPLEESSRLNDMLLTLTLLLSPLNDWLRGFLDCVGEHDT